MTNQSDSRGALGVLIAWAGTVFGAYTLQQWVLIATLGYTLLQIVLSLRKLWRG
jgi:hypothetical protein